MKQLSKESVFQSAHENFGILPPLIREIAEFSVPAAALYVEGVAIMHASAFSETEINAIELRVSALNACESCIKGHSFLLKKSGVSEEDIQAIIDDRSTSSPSLNRLMRGTNIIVKANRHGYEEYAESLHYNFSRQEIFEIIGLLSLKTISNNINNYSKAMKQLEMAVQ